MDSITAILAIILVTMSHIPGVIILGLLFMMFLIRKRMKREMMIFIGVIMVLSAICVFIEYLLWFLK